MIGLDTNILARHIAQDDPKQSPIASALIEGLDEERRGYIPLIVLVELVWLFQARYDARKDEIVRVVDTILRIRGLHVEQAPAAWEGLRLFERSNADFADCLIQSNCAAAGCDHVLTFDAKAAKCAGMRLARKADS